MPTSGGHVAVDVADPASAAAAASLPPVPYVLSFTDLSYSVKKPRGPTGHLLPPRGSNRLASATDSPFPSSLTPASNTKALLSGISRSTAAACGPSPPT